MNYSRVQRKQLSSISRQEGWTMWSLMFILGVIALFAYIGLQLFPIYTTNANVENAMKVAIDNLDKSKVNRAAIVRTLNNQLYLDGADSLLDYKNDLEIKRTQRELIVNINYERKVHLFFNLSLVATFENEVKRQL